MQLTYSAYVDHLAGAGRRFAALVERADPQTAVPSCPGWSIADLVEHLIGVQRWALSKITDAEAAPLDEALPLVERFRLGAGELVAALRERRADAPCWTLYPPAVAGTWARRQAHEVAIHLWDAANALGKAVDLEPVLARDGIAEVVEDMYPRQVRLGRQEPLKATVELAVRDASARVILAGSNPASIDAVVSGTASDVLLLLWGRRDLESGGFEVSGDAAAARAMLAAALVP